MVDNLMHMKKTDHEATMCEQESLLQSVPRFEKCGTSVMNVFGSLKRAKLIWQIQNT